MRGESHQRATECASPRSWSTLRRNRESAPPYAQARAGGIFTGHVFHRQLKSGDGGGAGGRIIDVPFLCIIDTTSLLQVSNDLVEGHVIPDSCTRSIAARTGGLWERQSVAEGVEDLSPSSHQRQSSGASHPGEHTMSSFAVTSLNCWHPSCQIRLGPGQQEQDLQACPAS